MNMLNTPEAAEVRARFPQWDDMTVNRHLEQRQALRRLCEEQRRERLYAALEAWRKGRTQ
jgi:hypothetical protein